MKKLNIAAIILAMSAGTAFAGGDYTKSDEGHSSTGTMNDSTMGQESRTPNVGMDAEAQTHANFNALDTNGDGYISDSEVSGYSELDSSFSSLDQNDDGQLSAEEFSDYKTQKSAW